MRQSKRLFYLAAFAAFINAIVHFSGAAIAGFASSETPTLIVGALWLLIAAGLKAKQRWLAYFGFLLAIVSGLFVYARLGTDTPLPQWLIIAIVVMNLVITVLLFLLIWRKTADKQAT